MILKRKIKKGFTLVELIVTLTIVGITGLFLADFLGSQLRVYQRLSTTTDAQYMCSALFEVLEAELRFGKEFEVEEDGEISTLTYIVVAEDRSEEVREAAGEYDSETQPFIPDNRILRVKYETDAYGSQVLMTIYVYDAKELDEKGAAASVLYSQQAAIHSMYTKSAN